MYPNLESLKVVSSDSLIILLSSSVSYGIIVVFGVFSCTSLPMVVKHVFYHLIILFATF